MLPLHFHFSWSEILLGSDLETLWMFYRENLSGSADSKGPIGSFGRLDWVLAGGDTLCLVYISSLQMRGDSSDKQGKNREIEVTRTWKTNLSSPSYTGCLLYRVIMQVTGYGQLCYTALLGDKKSMQISLLEFDMSVPSFLFKKSNFKESESKPWT